MYRRGSAIAQQGGSRRAMIALSTVPYENKVADTVMSGHAADLSAEYCILKFLGANDSLLSGIVCTEEF